MVLQTKREIFPCIAVLIGNSKSAPPVFSSSLVKPCDVKLYIKDVKYDLLSLSSNKHHFFRVNFLINAAFEDAAFIVAFKRGNTVYYYYYQAIEIKEGIHRHNFIEHPSPSPSSITFDRVDEI